MSGANGIRTRDLLLGNRGDRHLPIICSTFVPSHAAGRPHPFAGFCEPFSDVSAGIRLRGLFPGAVVRPLPDACRREHSQGRSGPGGFRIVPEGFGGALAPREQLLVVRWGRRRRELVVVRQQSHVCGEHTIPPSPAVTASRSTRLPQPWQRSSTAGQRRGGQGPSSRLGTRRPPRAGRDQSARRGARRPFGESLSSSARAGLYDEHKARGQQRRWSRAGYGYRGRGREARRRPAAVASLGRSGMHGRPSVVPPYLTEQQRGR